MFFVSKLITELPAPAVRVHAGLARGIVRRAAAPGTLPAAVSLDAGVWDGRPLRMRARRPGDRLHPCGPGGTRKLQDILVDAKVPRERRERLPVLVCGGEVVWVPGLRVAQAWRVRDARRRALQIRVEPL